MAEGAEGFLNAARQHLTWFESPLTAYLPEVTSGWGHATQHSSITWSSQCFCCNFNFWALLLAYSYVATILAEGDNKLETYLEFDS